MRYLFLFSSVVGVLKLAARKPENCCVALSLGAGAFMWPVTMHLILHGSETQRLAIAQLASASTVVCTIVFVLSVSLSLQAARGQRP